MSDLYDRRAAEHEVREALATVFYPKDIDPWLTTPAPAFGGRSAKDLLDVGDKETVLAVIDQLASGAVV